MRRRGGDGPFTCMRITVLHLQLAPTEVCIFLVPLRTRPGCSLPSQQRFPWRSPPGPNFEGTPETRAGFSFARNDSACVRKTGRGLRARPPIKLPAIRNERHSGGAVPSHQLYVNFTSVVVLLRTSENTNTRLRALASPHFGVSACGEHARNSQSHRGIEPVKRPHPVAADAKFTLTAFPFRQARMSDRQEPEM